MRSYGNIQLIIFLFRHPCFFYKVAHILRVFRGRRALRSLRIYSEQEVKKYMRRVASVYDWHAGFSLVVLPLVYMLFIAHVIACLW